MAPPRPREAPRGEGAGGCLQRKGAQALERSRQSKGLDLPMGTRDQRQAKIQGKEAAVGPGGVG